MNASAGPSSEFEGFFAFGWQLLVHALSFLFFFLAALVFMLCTGFLSPWSVGTTLRCGVQASHCGDFCHRRAQALGMQTSVVLMHGGLVASWHVVSSQTRD